MRIIKFIVLHCTAGPQDQPTDEIKAYWVNVNGWKNPGYHEEINADGTLEEIFPIEQIANGVLGFNKESIHISYKGGIDKKGNPIDNRTPAQIATQIQRVKHYKKMFPNAVVLGHRDFSRDANGNGIIERWEFIKSCPAFDVRNWLLKEGLEKIAKPSGIVYKLNSPLIKDSFVGKIQAALAIKQDNYFGKKTEAAIIAFQKRKGLPITGIADDTTISLLGIR